MSFGSCLFCLPERLPCELGAVVSATRELALFVMAFSAVPRPVGPMHRWNHSRGLFLLGWFAWMRVLGRGFVHCAVEAGCGNW